MSTSSTARSPSRSTPVAPVVWVRDHLAGGDCYPGAPAVAADATTADPTAEAYSRRPPRYAYALASAGQELAGALRLLAAWGAEHTDDTDGPKHTLCGTPLEVRWHCPTCDAPVDDPQADELRYA